MAKYVLVITEAILNILQCDSQMVKLSVSQAVPRCIPGFESRLGHFFFFFLYFFFFFTCRSTFFLLQIISISDNTYSSYKR